MIKIKPIWLITVFTIVALVGGVFLLSDNNVGEVESEATESVNVKVQVEETSFDWGEIGINDGKAEKTFKIKNDGTDELKLFDIETSCMCTTAQLSIGDTKSPEFGMHSKSNYVMKVPGGEFAELKIVFDPAFHGPSGVGPINRQIKVATNDQSMPVLNFMLTAMVRK